MGGSGAVAAMAPGLPSAAGCTPALGDGQGNDRPFEAGYKLPQLTH